MENQKAHTKKYIPEVVYEFYDEDISNPMLLWIELNTLFLEAAKTGNDNLIKKKID